jgi:hypothetical protein
MEVGAQLVGGDGQRVVERRLEVLVGQADDAHLGGVRPVLAGRERRVDLEVGQGGEVPTEHREPAVLGDVLDVLEVGPLVDR